MKTVALSLLLLALPAAGQNLDVGMRVGIPLNDAIHTSGALLGASQNWTAGPTLEVNLPANLGLEFDILYRKVGYSGTSVSDASAWTFPLLAKYKLPGKTIRPYVGAGFAARKLTDVANLDVSGKGFVLEGGVRLDLKLVRISPEIRWTRWGADRFNLTNLSSARDQADILIGITF
jgi:hypothetical protein